MEPCIQLAITLKFSAQLPLFVAVEMRRMRAIFQQFQFGWRMEKKTGRFLLANPMKL